MASTVTRLAAQPQTSTRRLAIRTGITLRRPRLTIGFLGILILISGIWGLGVLQRFDLAGYDNPSSDSAAVERSVGAAVDGATPDIVAIYTAPPGQTLDGIRGRVLSRFDGINPASLEGPIESYWTTTGLAQLAMVSSDHAEALAAVTLAGTESSRLEAYPAVAKAMTVPGVQTRLAGFGAITDAFNAKSKHDIVFAESLAIPLTLLLLVVTFGGVVAASAPVIVGGLTVFGSLGALRLVSIVTDVSAFALNVTSIIGLGLAIDYSLFLVSRFREELPDRSPLEAARRAVATAGRAIVFSAILLIAAFAGCLLFPIPMLRSLAYGAFAAIALSAVLSLTALPAALTLLGTRINALPWRREAVRRGEQRAQRQWLALANRVLRRPVTTALSIVAVLALLSLPLLGIRTGGIDPNTLPEHDPTRAAQTVLAHDFPGASDGVTLVIRGPRHSAPAAGLLEQLETAVEQTHGVRAVVPLDTHGDTVVMRALLSQPDFSTGAESAVRALHALRAPRGLTVLIGGLNATRVDSYAAIVGTLPAALAVVVAATLIMMFVAFRSILLPLKAVAMAAMSLSATFGLLTWIFVDGHGARLLGSQPGPLPLPALVVVAVAVFGLSTDYEVFLISRMVEAHQGGAGTDDAVRAGVSRTGRVITAAASLFVIVTGAAALSDVTLIKVAALGMALAIAIDATIVRMLLVPALVKLMGRANWWSPLYRRARRGDPHEGQEPEAARHQTEVENPV